MLFEGDLLFIYLILDYEQFNQIVRFDFQYYKINNK